MPALPPLSGRNLQLCQCRMPGSGGMVMKPVSKRFAALAVAALAAGMVTACTSSSGSTASSGGTPVSGGTLNFVAAGDVDHLDTLSAYYLPTFQLEVAFTRQLVSYWPSNHRARAITIAPDVASTVPTASNGGITNGGKTYTFRIRSGVDWNSSPPRQVTSADFLREFKAMCNPVFPVGNQLYYVPVIAGMSAYCDQYAAAFKNSKSPTASSMANFQNSHSISGIKTPNSLTIQFTLTQSANDFLNILAMPFASARPVRVRQLPAGQCAVPGARAVRRPVRDHPVHREQEDRAEPEPGLGAVHRPAAAPVRQPDRGDRGNHVEPDRAGRRAGRHR